MNQHLFFQAFKDSFPVIFGYVPLGMAFGVLFNTLGYQWYISGVIGLTVYSGAAQFMAVGLLSRGAGLVEVAISTLILNARHMVYGISLIEKYQTSFFKKFYLIFSLTDETYSLITSKSASTQLESSYYLYVSAINHFYWSLGCLLGGFVGHQFELNIPGLEFALVALFVVLTIEQFKSTPSCVLLISGVLAGIGALIFFPNYLLIVAMLMCCVGLYFFGRVKKWQLT